MVSLSPRVRTVFVLQVWCLFALAAQASAAPITVLSPDFEPIPPAIMPTAAPPSAIPGGTVYLGNITNWNVVNAGGLFAPDFGAPGAYSNTLQPTLDTYVAFSDSPTYGLIYQDLAVKYTANTIYTLSVDIGRRPNTAFGGGIGFFEINNPFPSAIGYLDLIDPGEGNVSRQTFVLSLGAISPTLSSQFVRVGLFAYQATATTVYHVDFDNVSVDASPATAAVPAPATLCLLGLGLVASAWHRSQPRRS
jgi:hypothetical protein